MFSHTAKGQAYNMPLLSRFTQATARLIDYELLTGRDGKRTVAFGWYAGAAGVPEALSALAHDHLTLGVSSPFLVSNSKDENPSEYLLSNVSYYRDLITIAISKRYATLYARSEQ